MKRDGKSEFLTFNTLFSVKHFFCELFAIVLTDSKLAPTSAFLLMHGVNSSKKNPGPHISTVCKLCSQNSTNLIKKNEKSLS
jgi:hypothetical protein